MDAPPRHNRLLRMTRRTQAAAQPAPGAEELEEEELLPVRKQAARTCESYIEAFVSNTSYHISGMGVFRSAS